MEAHRKFVLSTTAQHDPETGRDALAAERLGFVVRWRESGREDEPRPVVVAPDELLSNAEHYRLLTRLAQASGCVLRGAAERPAIDVEGSRTRGFSDEEIARELQPWRAVGVALSEAEVARQA